MHNTCVRALLIAVLLASGCGSPRAAPQVRVVDVPECNTAPCRFAPWADPDGSDAARITVKGVGPKPLTAIYFDDYGPRLASLARDARGTWYVLMPYCVGHGTGFSVTYYLGVLRVGSRLDFVKRARIRYWTAMSDATDYDYSVVARPRGGGLVIRLKRPPWRGERDPIFPVPPRVKYLRVR